MTPLSGSMHSGERYNGWGSVLELHSMYKETGEPSPWYRRSPLGIFSSTITKERFVVESLCASRSQRFLCFGTSGYVQESMESNTEFDSQPMLEESVSPSMQIDPRRARFPCCIVWTPLPVISWLVPFIGHIGICREDGVILDFAGPNFVCVDNFTFGAVARYIQLSKEKCCISPGFTGNGSKYPEFERETLTWDDSLRKSTQEFQNRSYNLFTCNCHSFVANNLNRLGYGGKGRWNVVNLAALIFLKGQWVNGAAILKAFLPFVLVLGLGLILGGWNFLIFLASFTFILVGWFVLGTYCFKSLIGL